MELEQWQEILILELKAKSEMKNKILALTYLCWHKGPTGVIL